MSTINNVYICGTGSYVPNEIVDNTTLARKLGVDEEWILRRTGIRERRKAAPEEATSDLAIRACKDALAVAGLKADDVGLLILATSTPDTPLPASACIVASSLGCNEAQAFDVSSSCSGFVNAVSAAHALIATGAVKYALVVGSEIRSRFTDFSDPDTFSIYGDGAGAVVLGSTPEDASAKIKTITAGSDGSAAGLISIPAGGSRAPASTKTVTKRLHTVHMQGRAVFRRAVRKIPDEIEKCAKLAGLDVSEIDIVVPHQMNRRLIEAVAKRIGLPLERFFVNLDRYGNTSAASIPLALDEAVRQGMIKSGQTVCLSAFGGGLAWGTVMLEWL